MKLRIFEWLAIASLVAPPSISRAADLTTLVNFNGTNGADPFGVLITDANGNLFSTTGGGGAYPGGPYGGFGTVLEITKTSSGYASTPTTLASFNGTDGEGPFGGLIADANGNLFGVTAHGGANGLGTVFEIAKTSSGYASTPTTLVSFNGTDGAYPFGTLIADANGNLFGTTSGGGANVNGGTVFEIAKTSSGYASTPTILYTFCAKTNCTDGAFPYAGLIADANGNLFGTTYLGGAYAFGTVFEIAKTARGYVRTPTTLVSFKGTDGDQPTGGLIADAKGNLFGVTHYAGANGHGTVFEVAKTARGYVRTPTTLVSFKGTDGAYPTGGLIADANGNLFGTTQMGGAYGDGTVFKLQTFAGLPGHPNCVAKSVSTLVQKYGGLNAVTTALGFPSVNALHDAIMAFCAG